MTTQTEPSKLISDELCFSPDPGSLFAQLALKNMMAHNIEDCPDIVLHAEPSKKQAGTYHIRAVTTIQSDRDVELNDTYSTYIFYNQQPYAVDHIFRHAEMSSLAFQAYKTQRLDAIRDAKTLLANRLPSLPYEGMTKEEIKQLPLPYFITVNKHYVLSALDEFGDLVSKDALDDEIEELEAKAEAGIKPDLDDDDDDDGDEDDKELEEERQAIEEVEQKFDIKLEYAEETHLEKAYERNAEYIMRGLSDEVAQSIAVGLTAVRVPSEFLCVLEYTKEGMPTYVMLAVEPSGVKEITRIKPEQGQLVSIATKALTNLHEDMLAQRIRLDGRHHQVDMMSNFDCNLIEQYADVYDNVHCVKFGWPE